MCIQYSPKTIVIIIVLVYYNKHNYLSKHMLLQNCFDQLINHHHEIMEIITIELYEFTVLVIHVNYYIIWSNGPNTHTR